MGVKKTFRQFGNAFEKLDFLGQDVKFNIGGANFIQSKVGSFVSLNLASLFLLYAIIRANQLAFRKDVDVTQLNLEEAFPLEKGIDLQKVNFKIAFGVTGYFNKENKDDPAFVEWEVNFENQIGNNEFSQKVSIHKCTDEDYASFYPVVRSQEGQLAKLKQKQSLYCIDKGFNSTIFGFNDDTDFRRLDAKLMPCRQTETKVCNKTLNETIQYIGASQLIMYVNFPSFNQENFKENKILKQSRIFNKQFDNTKPNFFRSLLRETTLEDNISWLNVGIPVTDQFHTPHTGDSLDSAWFDYPNKYRITGFELLIDTDVTTISRTAYDILGWIGDIGGVLQGLQWIGFIIVGTYYAPANGNSYVVTKLFNQASQNFKKNKLLQMVKIRMVSKLCRNVNQNKLIAKNIHLDLIQREKIPRWRFLRDALGCCTHEPQMKRQKLFIQKGLKKLTDELDILHILKQIRLLKLVYRAKHTGQDRKLLEKLTKKVLSSDSDFSSSSENAIDLKSNITRSQTKTMAEVEDSDYDEQQDIQLKEIERVVNSKEFFNQNIIKIWKNKDNSRMRRWHLNWLEHTENGHNSQLLRMMRSSLWKHENSEHKKARQKSLSLQHSLTIPKNLGNQLETNNQTIEAELEDITQEPFSQQIIDVNQNKIQMEHYQHTSSSSESIRSKSSIKSKNEFDQIYQTDATNNPTQTLQLKLNTKKQKSINETNIGISKTQIQNSRPNQTQVVWENE